MKMSDREFEIWAGKLGLQELAIQTIQQIRSSDPARRTESRRKNVSGIFPSHKMDSSIQFESRTPELGALLAYELDPGVREFLDQPRQVVLHYKSKEGKDCGHRYIPDFLVLRENEVVIEEWKPEEKMFELAENSPNRYVCENGVWRCPPAEEAFAAIGLPYRIRTDGKAHRILSRNLSYLEDYYCHSASPLAPELISKAETISLRKPGISFTELRKELGCSVDDIHLLIATGKIFVNLAAHFVGDQAHCPVFAFPQMEKYFSRPGATSSAAPVLESVEVKCGTDVTWNGEPYRIASVLDGKINLVDSSGGVLALATTELERLARAGEITTSTRPAPEEEDSLEAQLLALTPDQIKEACARMEVIEGTKTTFKGKEVPDATRYLWAAKARKALAEGSLPVLALASRHSDKGHRHQLAEDLLNFTLKFIGEKMDDLRARNVAAVHAMYKAECVKAGLSPVCEKTFRKLVNLGNNQERKTKREGRKKAYQTEEQYLELLGENTPPHGDHPFHIAHVDHTEIDLELICPITGKSLGRLWLTLMTSAYCREVLAFVVTFDPPSYRSVLGVMRECLRRHGRLPQILVVDGGKEFEHDTFCYTRGLFSCTVFHRPYSEGRYGSVLERLFGTATTMLFHNMLGNTKATKVVRTLTKETDPKTHAVWTPLALYIRLEEFVYKIIPDRPLQSLGMTPREKGRLGRQTTGYRSHRIFPFTEKLQVLLLPSTPKGTAKVQPGLGVKIKYEYYWCKEFADIANSTVEVRYDHWDRGVAYAKVHSKWVKLVGRHAHLLRGRTEKEIAIGSQIILKTYKKVRRGQEEFMVLLGNFLLSTEEEEVRLQQQKDAAIQAVREFQERADKGTPAPIAPVAKPPAPAPLSKPKDPKPSGTLTLDDLPLLRGATK